VWFDEYELVLGDSLRAKVGDGLQHSRVGVVILSRNFFAKRWPQWELDGLTARHIAGEQNVILPVWHEVGPDDVRSYSPPLADLFAAKSGDGVDAVADCVLRVLRTRAADDAPKIDDAAGRQPPNSRWHRQHTSIALLGAVLIAVTLIAIAALLTGTFPVGDGDGDGDRGGDGDGGRFVSSSAPGSRSVTFNVKSGSVSIETPPRDEVADCWRFTGTARLRAGKTLVIGARRVDPPDRTTYYQAVTWTEAFGRGDWRADRRMGSEVGQIYRVSVVVIATSAARAAENDQRLPPGAEIRWLRPDLLHKFEGAGNCAAADR